MLPSGRTPSEHVTIVPVHVAPLHSCLDKILIGKDGEPSFSGYLQSDGLRAYRTFIERHSELNIIPV